MPSDAETHDLTVPIDPARDHLLGAADAPVTLLDALLERCQGRLRFAFRHFPIFTLHRHASIAAQAAEAAGAQGKFWEMHDLLYLNQDRLNLPDFTHHALRIGLEVYKFESAL